MGAESSPLALVTGASSGIGYELAKVYAENGYDVVLAARRRGRLEEVAEEVEESTNQSASVVKADLASARGPQRLVDEVLEEHGLPDALVNNAGVAHTGPFQDLEPNAAQSLVQLNVSALVALTSALVEPMVERGSGHVLNVSSVTAFQPVPSLALYAASKAFVLSFTESLSEDLRGTGVTATCLCPGLTQTEMAEDMIDDAIPEAFRSLVVMDARSVARAGYRAARRGKVVEVPGVANEMAVNWMQFQPRWLVRAMGGVAARRMSFGQED